MRANLGVKAVDLDLLEAIDPTVYFDPDLFNLGPLAEEATIDAKPSFTIALLLNYYLVIGRLSRENERRNSIESEGVIM